MAACEAVRIFFSWKGNLTESASSVIAALVLCVPGVFGVIYFLVWQVIDISDHVTYLNNRDNLQTYVLRIEVILCALALTMQSLHLIFSLIAIITFSSS